jgi:hypothetical protein
VNGFQTECNTREATFFSHITKKSGKETFPSNLCDFVLVTLQNPNNECKVSGTMTLDAVLLICD